MCKVYGYARVSTPTQRLDRQVKNITDYIGNERLDRIFKEKYTGTKLNRPEFQKLLKILVPGDTVIFDSISRMSRTAQEGFDLYMRLMKDGIELIFLKESYCNTAAFKELQRKQITCLPDTGNTAVDDLMNSIIDALNKYALEVLKQQIETAFAQAEKEVTDLHTRISEGMHTTQRNNKKLPITEQKQIGRATGTKIETKKSKEMKINIQKMSKDFDGNMNDQEIINVLGIARNSFYKYKRELKSSF